MSTLDWILTVLNGVVYVLAHMNGRNQGLARATKVLESTAPQPERLTAAEWAARAAAGQAAGEAAHKAADSAGPRL